MKTLKLFLIVSLFFVTGITKAQDVIVKKDKTEIQALITRVSDDNVEYKKWNNQQGPTFSIGTDKISKIIYSNGDVDVFNTTIQEEKTKTQNTANTDAIYEINETLLQNQLREQQTKLDHASKIIGVVGVIGGIGGGIGLIVIGFSTGASIGIGVGSMLGVLLIGMAITQPYRNSIKDINAQLDELHRKRISLSPSINVNQINGQYSTGLTLSYKF